MIRVQIPLIVSIKTPTRHRNLRFLPLGKSEIGPDWPRQANIEHRQLRSWALVAERHDVPVQNTEKAVVRSQSNGPSPTSESMNREAIRRHLVQAEQSCGFGREDDCSPVGDRIELARKYV